MLTVVVPLLSLTVTLPAGGSPVSKEALPLVSVKTDPAIDAVRMLPMTWPVTA